ncbi:MAG: aminotransferase class I/II-fold pyridoxal phosphate-dependent enzyme [Candidatus Binatia bacterium]
MTAHSGITGRRADAIASSIERGIAEGRLGHQQALPPVRSLAESLQVSPTTVASAYRMLRQRGLVVGEGRRGTRVAHREAAPRLPIPTLAGAVNLADGNPDPVLLPDLEPLLRRLAAPRDLYGEPCALPELAAVGRRLLAADGIDATALSVVSGAMDGMERILATQLRSGDRVAVEDPAFAGVLDLLAALGLVAVPFAIDSEGPDPDSLERVLASGVQAVVVTPRAQNPTGTAVSEARAALLRKVLDRHPSVLLVQDDHAAGVAGAPLVSLHSKKRARHAYLRSMAKALGPDVRVALLVGSPDIVSRVEARQLVGMRWVSRLLQRLVVAALEDRTVTTAVARAEKEYARRRRELIDALAARGVKATGASGLNVWIPVREEGIALQALAGSGWSVAPGERFRLQASPGLRVTVSRLGGAPTERFAADAAAALIPGRGRASA